MPNKKGINESTELKKEIAWRIEKFEWPRHEKLQFYTRLLGGKPQFSKKLESVSNITNETPSTLSTVLKIYQKQYGKKKTS